MQYQRVWAMYIGKTTHRWVAWLLPCCLFFRVASWTEKRLCEIKSRNRNSLVFKRQNINRKIQEPTFVIISKLHLIYFFVHTVFAVSTRWCSGVRLPNWIRADEFRFCREKFVLYVYPQYNYFKTPTNEPGSSISLKCVSCSSRGVMERPVGHTTCATKKIQSHNILSQKKQNKKKHHTDQISTEQNNTH